MKAHYGVVIKEIVKLDATDKAGLRTKYYAAQDAEARKLLLAKIAMAARSLEPAKAITEINVTLTEMKLPPKMKIEALQHKLRLLKKMGEADQASKLLDEMIDEEGINLRTKNMLVVQQAYVMVKAGKVKEALEKLDSRIAQQLENLELFIAKGELLDRVGKHAEAIVEYDRAIKGAEGDPDRLAELYSLKAESLTELGKAVEAMGLMDKFIERKDFPAFLRADMLVQKSILLKEAGKIKEAKEAQEVAVEMVEDSDERDDIRDLVEQLGKIK